MQQARKSVPERRGKVNYAQHFQRGTTPQSEQAHPAQVTNSAGGYSFQIDCWGRLARFLVLGSEGGTYYVGERDLTRDNAKAIDECLATDPARAVQVIADISDAGRAPKNSPAIFALVLAASHTSPAARREALRALPKVCRTGTHLFEFFDAISKQRGFGRGLRRALAAWYTSKSEVDLCRQLAKYRQRNGVTHRDVFRQAHPDFAPELQPVARWVVGAEAAVERHVARGQKAAPKSVTYASTGLFPAYLQGFNALQQTDSLPEVVRLIGEHGFTHEMVPSQWLKELSVWEALLTRMPMTAMIRNLGRMTAIGLLKPMSDASRQVVSKLRNETALRKARVHPIAVLLALTTYQSGRGLKGSLSWSPTREIVDALDEAFYLAFSNVEATGKRVCLALDVSGSMQSAIAGTHISARTASAAMAMVTARTESAWHCVGFMSGGFDGGPSMHYGHRAGIRALNISPRQRLDDIVRGMDRLPFGGTDCALPMLYAQANKLEFDAFCVYTDSETWHGAIHPHEALCRYRQATGIGAKLIVVGMTSGGFTIANPEDPGMLDVVGFDAAAPAVMSDFIRGSLDSEHAAE